MNDLLTILVYAWLVVTVLLVVAWILRRRELSRSAAKAAETAAATTTDAAPVEIATETPSSMTPNDRVASNDGVASNDRVTSNDGTQSEITLDRSGLSGSDRYTADPKTSELDLADHLHAGHDPTDDELSNHGLPDHDLAGLDATGLDLAGDDGLGSASGQSADERPVDDQPAAIESVLAVIDLPYDLLPITAGDNGDQRHRRFLCRHPDASAVGTALADELERLGFHLEPVGFDQIRAVRDAEVLVLKMVPQAADEFDGARRRYPGAAGDDVAVEIWADGRQPASSN